MGMIFAGLGVVFLISGTVCLLNPGDPDAGVVGLVHTLLGAVFFVLGAVFAILEAGRRRKARILMESGYGFWSRIVRLEPNPLIRINGRHPFYAVVSRETSETYRSDSFMSLRGREDLIGRNVRVYLGEKPGKDYYVDIASVLEQ